MASQKLREENALRERDNPEESSKIRTKVANGFRNIVVIADFDIHNFRGMVGQRSWIGEEDSRMTYWWASAGSVQRQDTSQSFLWEEAKEGKIDWRGYLSRTGLLQMSNNSTCLFGIRIIHEKGRDDDVERGIASIAAGKWWEKIHSLHWNRREEGENVQMQVEL